MQVIPVTDNSEFKLNQEVIDRNGMARIATRNGSVFNGKTFSLQVKGPGGNWYDTGISFKEGGAQATYLRENMTYRFASDSDYTGITLNFLFF